LPACGFARHEVADDAKHLEEEVHDAYAAFHTSSFRSVVSCNGFNHETLIISQLSKLFAKLPSLLFAVDGLLAA
jgi:hypothetical protein